MLFYFLPFALPITRFRGLLEFAILGSIDLSSPFTHRPGSPNSNAEIIRIEWEEYIHPKYDTNELHNDLMVLKLERPSTRKVLAINSNDEIPALSSTTTAITKNSNVVEDGIDENVQQHLVALGFGFFDDENTSVSSSGGGESYSRYLELREASLDYISNAECITMYKPLEDIIDFPEDSITSDMLCTFTSGRDTCGGDSGGPLILLRRPRTDNSKQDEGGTTASTLVGDDWEEIQVGVTSW